MILFYAFFVLTFLNAFKDIAIKQGLKGVSSGAMTAITSFVLIVVCVPMVIHDGIPSHIEPSFLWIVLGGGIFYNPFEKTPRPLGLGMNHAVAFLFELLSENTLCKKSVFQL